MYERFTDRARKVLHLAHQNAVAQEVGKWTVPVTKPVGPEGDSHA